MTNLARFLLLVFLFEGAVHAQGAPPSLQTSPGKLTVAEADAARDGVPFRLFSAWLEAFNSGDAARLGAFLESSWPGGTMNRELSLRDRSGGFDLRALEEATATSLIGVMQERDSDQFVRFNIVVKAEEPQRIASLNRLAIPRPAEFPVPFMSEAEIIAALRARLEKDSAADRFSGAVLVARNGKVLFSEAYGLADREKKVANTLDTRFRIGSMNKMFTGTAILQLVQAGKVKLTDPLGRFLDDYPDKDTASKVTIHHLLTHTGGTGDIFGPAFDRHRLELRTHNDYVALYGHRSPAFEPGTRWEYSNYGMVLLGRVIEKASGQSYYEYVARRIYKPAGMTRSGSEPESKDVPGRSIGYLRAPGAAKWLANTDTLPFRGTSAGGGYSTVGDLLKFSEALLGNKLLDAEHTQLLLTGKVDTPAGKYAYGFDDLRRDGAGALGHAGGAPGMNGMLRIFPKSGYVVVVLSNFDPPAAQRVAGFLELRLELKD
ncbi:MAG TPA: serine hydrolase domain-containing protein [Steroidobacteraceae bacterium]|nr:serine hydrolase domain-containing protein [Steroidobacteraceae bacterium]